MKEINYSLIFAICVAILIGILYVYINCKRQEGLENMGDYGKSCPNVLIQDGSGIYLKNNRLADIPGINPIRFENLEEYTEFYNWQKSQGIDCPVLYLQKSYNAQSDPVWKFRPSISEPEGGLNTVDAENNQMLLDANRNNPPYNNDSYPGFDPENQYIGAITPLDNLPRSQKDKKTDAMDPNWGGVEYSKQVVDSGEFAEDNVSIKIM